MAYCGLSAVSLLVLLYRDGGEASQLTSDPTVLSILLCGCSPFSEEETREAVEVLYIGLSTRNLLLVVKVTGSL